MTLRPLCTLLFLLCFHLPVVAQRALTWQPDTTLRIGGSVPFNRVAIEDMRPDKSNIGWLKTGAFNRYADLVMEDSVSTNLAAYMTDLLRGSEKASGELLVVLRDFRVEDRKAGEEIGTAHLRADLFRSDGSNNGYFHLRSFDTLHETKSALDVTKSVQALASQAVLDMSTAGATTHPSDSTLYSRSSALAREDEAKNEWPLYTSANPPRGIYHSFDDFLQLRTSDTDFIDIKVASPDVPTTWYFHRRNSRGKKGERIQPNDCLAIFDGKNWHIAHPRGFSLMKREGTDFYATLYMRGFADNSVAMGILFGAAGSVAAANDMGLYYTPYRSRLAPEARTFFPIRRAR